MAYGYHRRGKDVIPDVGETAIVGTIFELAARSRTPSEIARALNQKGLARRNGKAWTQRQVATIVSRAYFYRYGGVRYGEVRGQNKSLALLNEA